MESTLNDFFNEIDEIVPLKTTDQNNKEPNEWKECFDSKSGYAYYWNTRTNDVTWEKPKTFDTHTAVNGPVPDIPQLKDKIKIYKISATPQSLPRSNGNRPKIESKQVSQKKKSHSDSDDEKITLITSYGSGSSSEDENEQVEKTSIKKSNVPEDNMLSNLLKRAEELKKIGNADTTKVPKPDSGGVTKTPKPISGFSLVAGYDSNSEDESEEENPCLGPKKQFLTTPQPPKQAHSTLFPIMKTPDINDFEVKEDTPKKETEMENSFDMKNFKRKRRLGVSFVPNRNNVEASSSDTLEIERKGLGFKENDKEVSSTSTTLYCNFTKGGMEFVKSEGGDVTQKKENSEVDEKEIKEIYEILHEKLAFLCEGNKDVTPVQIILIQIETLYGALKAESLNPEYLHEWLQGTSEDLIKLEKEAAPEGWSLQWDRLQKRYYYQNQESGQTQWEYPQTQSETEGQEEAMDICTTPPPPEIVEIPIKEENPPSNRIPSPPPAPIISKPESEFVPEPQVVPPTPSIQPLPPGVDFVESTKNDMDSAFNTFYSELAEIEKTSKPGSPTNLTAPTEATIKVEETTEPIKKKRKKMKLGQGLSLKNKDVSKLVEKWKNVQNNY